MLKIEEQIKDIDKVICDNIELLFSVKDNRATLSQNILSQSRNLVEHIAVRTYGKGNEIDISWDNIQKALEYLKTNNKYLLIRDFHFFLQESKSHYTPNGEGAERLMQKYYPYYIHIKEFAKKEFGLELLHNIEKYPKNTDKTITQFHKAIADQLNKRTTNHYYLSEKMYIHKITPFVVDEETYYEMVLLPAYDETSKFDHFIVYSDFYIHSHYAINVKIYSDIIYIEQNRIPVYFLSEYAVSIRPCELNNFAKIFGVNTNIKSNNSEYIGIKNYLTTTRNSLLDLILFSDEDYSYYKNEIFKKSQIKSFEKVLDNARQIVQSEKPGSNVIRYLIHTMHNKTINLQAINEENTTLSCLKLNYGCIPFDNMPFATSLINHNPEMKILYECINSMDREHEIMDRYMVNKMVENSIIYTPYKELEELSYKVENNINNFNKKLYWRHENRKIERYGKNVYIKKSFDDTEIIIKKLLEKTIAGLNGYTDLIKNWLSNNNVDSKEKENVLKTLFDNSQLAIIYGSAGTGKTYLLNQISQLFDYHSKLLLANTNPAIENLRRKVRSKNCTYMTIFQFINKRSVNTKYDILVIDECSMVSNSDMVKIMQKVNCKLIILVGDTYQLKSIDFGNWFYMAQFFIPPHARHELKETYRTKDENLLKLWKKVRNLDHDLTEFIVSNKYATNLGLSVFTKKSDDEIILCLNYDGLYGVNNVNKLLQENNPNPCVQWGLWKYKKGDPILFNESERFVPIIYNNLKGTIIDIEKESEDKIWFTLEIDKALTELDTYKYNLKLLETRNPGKSIIKFYVLKKNNPDNDEYNTYDETDIPFQIAYAVSIHKAQGLEYDSVKIIITEEVDEMITHSIFYTSITRSKKDLTIYWSPETQQKVIGNLKKLNPNRDIKIFSIQSGLKIYKLKK